MGTVVNRTLPCLCMKSHLKLRLQFLVHVFIQYTAIYIFDKIRTKFCVRTLEYVFQTVTLIHSINVLVTQDGRVHPAVSRY